MAEAAPGTSSRSMPGNRCSNIVSICFLNSELAGMETTTVPSFLPASTTFFHSSAEAPQLLGANTKNKIATVVIQTTLLCRSREPTIRNSLLYCVSPNYCALINHHEVIHELTLTC